MSGESTKQAIFNTAAELFAKEGYHSVSMRQIAEEVGITPSSIYNHYPSKEAILLDLYHYFDNHMEQLRPDLNELLALVGRLPVRDIMRKTAFVYPQEILVPMSQAMLVTASMMRVDERADRLICKNLIDMPAEYDLPLLRKMMDMDLIEPIDEEVFTLLHSSYHYSAAVRFYTNHTIDDEKWLLGLDMLYDLIRPKQHGKDA